MPIIWSALVLITLVVTTSGPDPRKLVTRAEVEKVTAAQFKDEWQPDSESLTFEQPNGTMQITVGISALETGDDVRSLEKNLKLGGLKVEPVPAIGTYGIYFSNDEGHGLSMTDFTAQKVRLRIGVIGVKDEANRRRITLELARLISKRL